MGWLCEDCFLWTTSLEAANEHSDVWRHSLAVCPESRTGVRMVTIHDHPTDHPEHWVVRYHRILREGDQVGVGYLVESLEQAREHVDGMALIDANDPDPHIAEVWI